MNEVLQQVWDDMRSRKWTLDVDDVIEFEEWMLEIPDDKKWSMLWYFTYGDPNWTDADGYDTCPADREARAEEFLALVDPDGDFGDLEFDEQVGDTAGLTFESREMLVKFVNHYDIEVDVRFGKKAKKIIALMGGFDDIIKRK